MQTPVTSASLLARVATWMRDALQSLPSAFDDADPIVIRAMPPF